MSTIIQADVKAKACSLRPDCIDGDAMRVFLTLYPSEALKLVTDLVEAMDYYGQQQALDRVKILIRRGEW